MRSRMQTEPTRVYLSLGANLGDRWTTLRQAVRELRRLASGPLRCSGVYETRPVDYTDQPDFLNLAVELPVSIAPLPLLAELQRIEAAFGRVRSVRFGPRTLDIDILLYGNLYICYRSLQVPHPRMWRRAFVLVPLAELIPLRRALGGGSIRELAQRMSREGGVRRVGDLCEAPACISEIETPDAG
jgi:2-amino-4-hydroxy-6-hydroxymethyldihydropteridine diphosphokinase